MKFAFYTLGCKVNQYETNALKEMVLSKNLEVTEQNPDIFVINTCTVTAVSDKKNIKLIKKVKKENPNAIIAVCGCFAQISPEKAEQLEGVDIICGTDNRSEVIDMCIDSYKNQTKYKVLRDENAKFEVLPASENSEKTRGLLKIQDGCNNFCTYCIIPYARGRSRSMPFDEVLKQTEILSNHKEIVITGIEIASYGKDIGTNIIELLEKICKTYPKIRFRLGSLEPRVVTQEFCEKLSKFENLNPHFHLSLQSGCDTVLKRMNRKYDTSLFLNVCKILRDNFENPSITTDLIVGFPQETDEEFEQTIEFIQKCQFSSMHIFPYSIREGTKACDLVPKVDENTKNIRAKKATQIARQMEQNYLDGFLNKQIEIIAEKNSNGHSKYHFLVECDTQIEKGAIEKLRIISTKDLKVVATK